MTIVLIDINILNKNVKIYNIIEFCEKIMLYLKNIV